MKQPKLSFITKSKRRTEMDDKKNKEPRAKKARQDPENDLKESARKCEEKENICSVRFSNSMKDAVKTLCKVCGLAVTLTTMRGHTKSAHGLSIAEYKEKYGNHRTQIIERILHSCGLCAQVSLTTSSLASCPVPKQSSEDGCGLWSLGLMTVVAGSRFIC